MKLFFSPSAGGFYDEAIHAEREVLVEIGVALEGGEEEPIIRMRPNPACLIPTDVVEVSRDRHAELIAAQADGLVIVAGDGGAPEVVEPALSIEGQLAAIRRRRDRELAATDWTQLPDAMSAAKRKLWKDHRRALRDLPMMVEAAVVAGAHPATIAYPEAPG